MSKPHFLVEIENHPMPMSCRATDYPAGHVVQRHEHSKGQLIHAVHGVMMVAADDGQWIVPPTRGIWMPPGLQHWIRCIGVVQMRSVFVHPTACAHLPRRSQAVGITPLLRELILAATQVSAPWSADSRDGRLMQLLLDEMHTLPVLPLHLPQPTDARIRRICAKLLASPDDAATLGDWADVLDLDVKTIQRLFMRETGMTFGKWRQQARLLHALEQLARGDKVVSVALALGYDSPSAFASMFKRQVAVSPSAFFGPAGRAPETPHVARVGPVPAADRLRASAGTPARGRRSSQRPGTSPGSPTDVAV